jgi:hypothetical protein
LANSHYLLIAKKGKFEMTLNFIMELVKKIIFRSWPNLNDIYKEEFEDTKGVIRIRK